MTTGHPALEQRDGDHRERAVLSHGGGHRREDDEVERRLDGERQLFRAATPVLMPLRHGRRVGLRHLRAVLPSKRYHGMRQVRQRGPGGCDAHTSCDI